MGWSGKLEGGNKDTCLTPLYLIRTLEGLTYLLCWNLANIEHG